MQETAKIPIEKVRQLQRKLWVCAKPSRTRRFHALYDNIQRHTLMELVKERVSDRRVLKLICQWLKLRIPGMHDSKEAEYPAKPSLAFHAAMAKP